MTLLSAPTFTLLAEGLAGYNSSDKVNSITVVTHLSSRFILVFITMPSFFFAISVTISITIPVTISVTFTISADDTKVRERFYIPYALIKRNGT